MLTLSQGFRLEDPPLLIPWGLSRRQLVRLFAPYGLREINRDYYVLSCTSLCGLSHELEIRYDSCYGFSKYLLGFSSKEYSDQNQRYEGFQNHLEATFGPPTRTEPGEEGFPSHHWEIEEYEVSHVVYMHHDLQECVVISPQRNELSEIAELLLLFRCFPVEIYVWFGFSIISFAYLLVHWFWN